MKLKVNPDDFMVEEKINLKINDDFSAFRVYRLTKRNWNTIDAIRSACEFNNVPFEKVRYGGRKDRFAVTSQYITTPSDCNISYKRHNVSVDHEGYSTEPMSPKRISENQFIVTIRDMSEMEAKSIHDALFEASGKGFINYFDDQRFGGGGKGESENGLHFFAELLIKRQYERAVKMLLCNCHPEAPVPVKKRKQNMSHNWGNWKILKSIAAEKNEIKICDSLLKDSSTSGLIKILRDIPREEFGMYLSAYQSFIWNEVCAEIADETPEVKEIPTIATEILPAPENILKTIHSILTKRGVRASKLKIAEFKECGYFSSFMRAVKVFPEIFEIITCEDDLFLARFKLTAKFSLQAGSYATMLLKHVVKN
jgi:tRNA pseudouridine13 synthase